MTAEALFARWRDRIESQLDAALPSPAEAPQRLHQAMRYSVLGGGKRMRHATAPIRISGDKADP